MVEHFENYYPSKEKKFLCQLKKCINCWKNTLSDNDKKKFITDGFYPYYTFQRHKILFIGREAYGEAEADYIEEFYNGNMKGIFHNRILYIAFGILAKKYREKDWKEMPSADEIYGNFAKEDGISYAFMNISKLSNESGNSKIDLPQLNRFLDLPETVKFIEKEIVILSPDIIISANLGDIGVLGRFEGKLSENESGHTPDVHLYTFSGEEGRKVPWIDGWHFSARNKPTFESFYSPICNATRALL